ncbi:hypothetical protein [uncultured Aquitalea sp.]|uniref:hypothetical protein n=1 Tax=uncultured Aquitalea sp. TaxID=540272 RepID=UPI0025DC59F2|nr:hypothetical protein [uncultured Aquitalea sp.]
MGLNTVYGPSGLASLPLMTSPQGLLPAIGIYLAGLLAAYGGGFVLTWLWGCRNVDLD